MSSPEDTAESLAPGPGYEALTSGVAMWLDPDRVFLRIEGTRAAAVLNGLLSADVPALQPGDSTLSFVLTSKGRPVAVPVVIRTDESILLDLSRAALPGLLDHFGTYLPPRFASVTRLEDARRVSLLGPRATTVATGIKIPAGPIRVERELGQGGGTDFYFPDGGPDGTIEAAVRAAGGEVATAADYEIWRIEHGIPRFGLDITAENLPQETGLVSLAVSFDKGCYTGQEVVARIHYRGQVNRHLRGIRPAHPYSGPPVPHGTELTRDGRAVGATASWCSSPRLGPIGLAYVRRELTPGDEIEVTADHPFAGVVIELPFTST
ncbi:MAG: glycine cleavage T C-terminal barrel domain-containing protein [Gemmatimonadota bacterium]|jgi:folate-binding protein YgfZ